MAKYSPHPNPVSKRDLTAHLGSLCLFRHHVFVPQLCGLSRFCVLAAAAALTAIRALLYR